MEQADEVDSKYLQVNKLIKCLFKKSIKKFTIKFDGGVATTGIILEGIFKLAAKFKQMPAKFTQDRLTKFTNYLSSKRHVSNLRSSFYLLTIGVKLADNQVNKNVQTILNPT